MRKIIVTVTIVILIFSIVSTGLLSLFYSTSAPDQVPSISGE